MRCGVRYVLLAAALVLAGVGSASAILRHRAAGANRVLAGAATTRQVTASFMATPPSVAGIAAAMRRERPAAVGFGEASTWYGVDRATGRVTVGDLSPAASAARLAAGSGSLGALSADPVESDGVLFVATETSGLSALDLRTVAPIWTDANLRAIDDLTVGSGRLYVAERNAVRALDPATGRGVWSVPPVGVSTSVTAVAGDRICFGTYDRVLHVLRASDGHDLHAVRLERPATGSIAVAGNTAFVLANPLGGATVLPLYAIDLARGRLAWRFDTPPTATLLALPSATSPVVGDGVVCFSFEDWFYAVDAATGKERWHFQPPHDDLDLWRRSSTLDPLVSRATIRDGVAYVTAADRFLGISLSTGREVWRFQPPYSTNWGHSSYVPPRVRGNLVLGVLGQSLLEAAPLDPQRVTPAALVRSARGGSLGVAPVTGVAGLLLAGVITVSLLRRWRAALALMCLAITPAAAWSWAMSYSARQFVGQQRVTWVGGMSERVRRGIRAADGAVTIGAVHEIWQTALRPGLAGSGDGPLAWSDEPLDPAALAVREAPADAGLLSFGVTWHSRSSGTALGNQSDRGITFPHWFALAALAVPQLAWLSGRWRDRRRYPAGCCRA